MSAFLVGREHVDFLIRAAVHYDAHLWDPVSKRRFRTDSINDLRDLGRVLWAENRRSLRSRYGKDAEAWTAEIYAPSFTDPAVLKMRERMPGVAAVAKAIDCLEYQSCESDDWHQTPAFYLLQGLRASLVAALPGYERAAWAVSAGGDL